MRVERRHRGTRVEVGAEGAQRRERVRIGRRAHPTSGVASSRRSPASTAVRCASSSGSAATATRNVWRVRPSASAARRAASAKGTSSSGSSAVPASASASSRRPSAILARAERARGVTKRAPSPWRPAQGYRCRAIARLALEERAKHPVRGHLAPSGGSWNRRIVSRRAAARGRMGTTWEPPRKCPRVA